LYFVRDIFYAGASRALALSFDFILRYIADVLSLSNSRLGDFVDRIYPNDFEIKNTTNTARSAPHLNIHLEIVFQEQDEKKTTVGTHRKTDCAEKQVY
jgi:hypothetical protein